MGGFLPGSPQGDPVSFAVLLLVAPYISKCRFFFALYLLAFFDLLSLLEVLLILVLLWIISEVTIIVVN